MTTCEARVRTQPHLDDLDAIEVYIAKDSRQAATALWLEINDQVEKLADPNRPRRIGLIVPGTIIELVFHKNYVLILDEDQTTDTVWKMLKHAIR
jgi:plasmid stabilization system protein ParE